MTINYYGYSFLPLLFIATVALIYFLYLFISKKESSTYTDTLLMLLAPSLFICYCIFHVSLHNKPVITINKGISLSGINSKILCSEINGIYTTKIRGHTLSWLRGLIAIGMKREAVVIVFDSAAKILNKNNNMNYFSSFFMPDYYLLDDNSLILFCDSLNISAEKLIEAIKLDYQNGTA